MANSVASLFCFPINEIKELITSKYKLEEILQIDLFMLEVKLEPEILKSFDINESIWKKKKNIVVFKRLSRGETYDLENVYLILIFGKMTMDQNRYIQGCFRVEQPAIVEGPAKFYYASYANLR